MANAWRHKRRLRAVLACAGLILAGGAAWWLLADAGAEAARGPAGSIASAQPAASGGQQPGAPFSAAGQAQRREQIALWSQRLERAEQVYTSYRDSTRYPPESRPIAEHPDQVRPFDPVAEEKSLRDEQGRPVRGVRIRTTQEKVFLGGGESSRLTLQAVDDAGQPVPLVVERAAARSVPDTTQLITIVETPLVFSDDGSGADEQAGDGRYSTRLSPATQGFAQHAGTIRVLASVRAGSQAGVARFDLVYTPLVPATWAGVREALEGGSLNFYLKAQVRVPGRYVASARVYDAAGKPFALLQFNDVVPAAGPAEFRLQLFGALVRDKRPAFPLRLVDVDGFLLQADTFPDRAMMARLSGTVHVSQRYAVDSFSSAEWTSEERERYLAEYERDLRDAQDQLGRLRR